MANIGIKLNYATIEIDEEILRVEVKIGSVVGMLYVN